VDLLARAPTARAKEITVLFFDLSCQLENNSHSSSFHFVHIVKTLRADRARGDRLFDLAACLPRISELALAL